ncbi:MAG: hypothetical protein ACI97A_003275, partial [Planctomycetota bacterium]
MAITNVASTLSVLFAAEHTLSFCQIGKVEGQDTVIESRSVDLGDFDGSHQRGVVALLSQGMTAKNVIVIIGDHLQRSQIEFIPGSSKRNSTRALSNLAKPEPGEFPIFQKLAPTKMRGAPANGWSIAMVKSEIVDEITAELERHRVKIRKVVINHDLVRTAAQYFCQQSKQLTDTVFVSVGKTVLDLTYVVKGEIAFSRTMAISLDSDAAKRVASEMRRTSVFFHRNYPEAKLSRALVHNQECELEQHVVDEIEQANQIESIELVSLTPLPIMSGLQVNPADHLLLMWLNEIGRSGFMKLEHVDTPNAKRMRSNRRFGPSLAIVLTIICGLSFFYLLILEGDLESHRELHAKYVEPLAKARQTLNVWATVEQERHSVVHRANEINSILNAEIDLSAAMQEIARLTPSSVKV